MKNPLDYSGQRCLVTGCFSGMGEATGRVLNALGATVVAVDIKRPDSFAMETFHEVDLRDAIAIEEMVSAVAADGPIDKLFYCAGLPGTLPKLDVMLVNWVGLRHTVEQCVPHLAAREGGAAVSISSAAGAGYQGQLEKIQELCATPGPSDAKAWVEAHLEEPWLDGYAFSKMCTIAYTLQRAAILTSETGVRLNTICPGPTDTPMMPAFEQQTGKAFMRHYPKPIGRNSTPEEQAWPLAFLNSDAASYISGEALYTDGGGTGGMMTGALSIDMSHFGQD